MNCPPEFDKELLKPKFWPSWLGIMILAPIAWLPTAVRHKLAIAFGKLAYKYNHKRRNIVKTNLAHSFPEFSKTRVEELSQEHFKFAAMGILDISVHIFASKTRIRNMLRIDNQEYLHSLILNQGVLLLLAHSTFLDFMAVGTDKYKVKASYNPFNNKVVDWLVQYARCRFGSGGLIARDDGLRPIVRELKTKKPVVYLPDEDFGMEHSEFARFFAMDKATLTIPARLAGLTDSTCIPVMIVWDSTINKYRMKSLPALEDYPSGDNKQDARKLNQALEELIKPDLVQYMWTMKIFKTRPEGEEAIY